MVRGNDWATLQGDHRRCIARIRPGRGRSFDTHCRSWLPSRFSHAHIAAIRFPESANRSFRNPALAAAGLTAAHFEHRLLIRCAGDAALNETTDATILHGDVARGPDEIALLDAGQSPFGGVVGESDIGPVEISLVDGARDDLPDRDRVLNLLQNEGGKDR